MGAAPAIGALALLASATAAAEPCTALARDGLPYATCFDPGNRLVLSLTTEGVGAGVALRHTVGTDDPAVTWRFEHELLAGAAGPARWQGTVYAGRYLRHSRDGHLVLPTSPPRRLFLPFDVGAEAAVGRVAGEVGSPAVRLGAVRAAALVDLSRSADGRRRAAIGPVVRWDLRLDREARRVDEHRVAPFTLGVLELFAEDRAGLTRALATVEAGATWSSAGGWGRALFAEAALERVVLALNDRPLALYLAARWEDPGAGGVAEAGVRFSLFGRRRR